jgi:hypothetical protein
MKINLSIELTRPKWLRGLSRSALTVIVALLLTVAASGTALASHLFTDVPTTSIFHDAIGAIAGAGVTTGCGGSNYCPTADVTREQMAAFLHRGSARVAERDLPSTTAIPLLAAAPAGWTFQITPGIPGSALPGSTGFIKVDGVLTVDGPSSGCPCIVRAIPFLVGVGYMAQLLTLTTLNNNEVVTIPVSGVASVTSSGAKTIEIRVDRDGTGTITAHGNVTALYVPFGSQGTSAP